MLLKIGLLCNYANYDGTNTIGDPTEGALVVVAAKGGIQKSEVEKQHTRIGEIPFSSESERTTTTHDTPEERQVTYMKGSVKTILQQGRVYQNGKAAKLSIIRDEILSKNEEMANQALRP